MESPSRTQAITRTTFLAGGATLWGAAILGQLFKLQIFQHKRYKEIADEQQIETVDLPAPRGSIFDRNGEIFAMSEPVDSVYVNPMRVPNLAVAADVMAPVLHLDPKQLLARLRSSRGDPKRHGFFWVKRKITPAEKADIESLRISFPYIKLQADKLRHYPQNEVASHVIGSVDFAEKGNAGIELGLDQELRGEAGSEQMLTDVRKRGIESEMLDAPKAGVNLTLTIDERIQFVAERDLKLAIERTHAKTGTVVVMNPKNGEVLAMASYPNFDPNKPPMPGEPRYARLNRAVSAPFEPGSVFKVVTLTAALETTSLRPESTIPCGQIKTKNHIIHEAHGFYGPMSMADVLARSSNVGAIQIGERVGKENLYEYIHRYGFGQKTGAGLPAEESGWVRKLERWKPGSLLAIPMGHEVSVTAIQLARACSVVANGGLLVKPRLILKRQRAGGEIEEVKYAAPVRVIKPQTAFTMRNMMEGVIVLPQGTGHRTARLQGYSSAGKSGSAQIYDYAAGHYTKNYNASFMGFAPVTNPAVVVVVTLNGTSGNEGYGAAAAGPVFKTVTEEALRVLDIPKDIPDREPAANEPAGANESDVAIADLSDPPPLEESEEESHGAQPDQAKPRMIGPEPPPVVEQKAEVAGPKAPNFLGKSVRTVVEEAGALGLPVSLDGRGVARTQVPAPGASLPPGTRIHVVFAR